MNLSYHDRKLTTVLWMLATIVPFIQLAQCGVPAPERFFDHQIVDHVGSGNGGEYSGQEWSQRYYTWEKEFQGPGSPIFLILGGEGSIPPETGIFYPFVSHHLAKIFRGFVIQPEHRFYGKSIPIDKKKFSNLRLGQVDPRVTLFTPEQALRDALYLVDNIKEKLGCSKDKFSSKYCPVITVGGSYPGWLSAMARILFPDKVDMAYSASAPMRFYSQQVHRQSYYELITRVADDTIPGCASAVRAALLQVQKTLLEPGSFKESNLGICTGSTPEYIDPTEKTSDLALLVDELMMVVGYTFANANMGNYPPSNATRMFSACETFTSKELDAFGKVAQFLSPQLPPHNQPCWNFTSQLPSGKHATISSGDWSGVGTGLDGESWDFQTCTLLVEAIGFSNASMFPPREWSLHWLFEHCQQRFRVVPRPVELIRLWQFDSESLIEHNVSRIVFTNGLKDGWSVGGFEKNLTDSLIVINFPNGAHHSDLSGKGPSEEDTDDIKKGFEMIIEIIGSWLDEIRPPPSTL